jgi:hypothetical protein
MRTYDEIQVSAREGSAFSNSSQFEYWANGQRGCYSCRNDSMDRRDEPEKFCPILSVSMLGNGIPAEWVTFSEEDEIHGSYTCTEYDERRDDDGGDPESEPEPPPVVEGQIDMFEVFAERIADEAAAVQRQAVTR